MLTLFFVCLCVYCLLHFCIIKDDNDDRCLLLFCWLIFHNDNTLGGRGAGNGVGVGSQAEILPVPFRSHML